jgi:hypothetical protein
MMAGMAEMAKAIRVGVLMVSFEILVVSYKCRSWTLVAL